MITRLKPFVIAQLGLIAVAVTACGTTASYLTPSGSTTTLMAGWERHFTLDWTMKPEAGDTRQLEGHIFNQHGEYAVDVSLLAHALDGAGGIVGHRIAWVAGGVAGFGRSFFIIQHLPPADHYRVTVWTYTFHQSDGGAMR